MSTPTPTMIPYIMNYDNIVFMHIAKTAGSKVNSTFKAVIDGDRYLEHAEFNMPNIRQYISNNIYVSGHIYHGAHNLDI